MLNRNRYLEAIKESPNIVGMATALALSAAFLNPLPLLFGLVAEAAYLVFVPDSKWYETRLSARYDADVEARRAQIKAKILPTLRPAMQARFMRLEEMRHDINSQVGGEQTWFREVLRKLDFLLEKWLQFGAKETQFRAYLASVLDEVRTGGKRSNPLPKHQQTANRRSLRMVDDTDTRSRRPNVPPVAPGVVRSNTNASGANASNASNPALDPSERWVRETVEEVQAFYGQELDGLRQLMQNETDDSTRAVLDKRLDVLGRRSEFVGKMGRILSNLNHQLSLLEDTFGLISDEMLARPPEQVLADIEDVVSQTNTMTQVLEEVAPFEQLMARLSS